MPGFDPLYRSFRFWSAPATVDRVVEQLVVVAAGAAVAFAAGRDGDDGFGTDGGSDFDGERVDDARANYDSCCWRCDSNTGSWS